MEDIRKIYYRKSLRKVFQKNSISLQKKDPAGGRPTGREKKGFYCCCV